MTQTGAQVWQRLVLIAAEQQQLRGSNRTGGDDHSSRGLAAPLGLAAFEAVEIDAVSAGLRTVFIWFNVTDHVQGTDFRAVFLSQGDVVEIQCVLGFDLTSDNAVAAMHAGALLLPLRVSVLLRVFVVEWIFEIGTPIFVESHSERQFLEAVAVTESARAFFHQQEAFGQLIVRDGLHIEYLPDPVIVRLQFGVCDLRRPALLEQPRLRLDRNIGVDQRTASDARPRRHRHVTKISKIEPSVPIMRLLRIVNPGIVEIARIVFGLPPAASFEDQDFRAFLGQATGRHGPAKSAADYDDVKGL